MIPIETLAWTQIWQVTLVALVLGLSARFIARQRPHLAYLLWMLVLFKAITPPLWSSPAGVFSWSLREPPVEIASARQLEGVLPRSTALDAATVETVDVDAESATLVGPARVRTDTDRSPTSSVSLAQMLFGLWSYGMVGLATLVLLRWFALIRTLNRCVEADPVLQEQFNLLASSLGLSRAIRVSISDDEVGPAAAGVFRPVVILPQTLVRSGWSDELRTIAAHELMHHRRLDPAWGLVQTVAQIVWWFHPLMWWANRQASHECERCCDEQVIAELGCRTADYVRVLLEVLKSRRRPILLHTVSGVHRRTLSARRLEQLMQKRSRFNVRTPRRDWLMAAVVAAVVLPGAGLALEPSDPSGATSEVDSADSDEGKKSSVATDSEVRGAKRRATLQRWAVFPVRTALQRKLLRFPAKATGVYLTFDSQPFFDHRGRPREAAEVIDWESVDREVNRHKPENATKSILYASTGVRGEHSEGVHERINELYLESLESLEGFDRFILAVAFYDEPYIWPGERLTAIPSDANNQAIETPIVRNGVVAYPATTVLSHYLARADVVVDISGKFTSDWSGKLNPETRQDIKHAVGSLQLNERGKIAFHVHVASRDLVEPLRGELDPLAKSMSFVSSVVTPVRVSGAKDEVDAKQPDDENSQITPASPAELDALRKRSSMNVKIIGLAFHLYKDVYGAFPPAVVLGPDGKTTHSWRVAILPFLDYAELKKRLGHNQPSNSPEDIKIINEMIEEHGYSFDEPWDSDRNRAVLQQMPDVYRSPLDAARTTSTAYFGLTGAVTVFADEQGVNPLDIGDGTSNTMLVVETKRGVPWTQPMDIPYGASEPLPQLGGIYDDGYHVVFADGSWGFIPTTLPEGEVRSLIAAGDGEPRTPKRYNGYPAD